eukprot:1159662-Pelagomonas_calceolata.AAC.15
MPRPVSTSQASVLHQHSLLPPRASSSQVLPALVARTRSPASPSPLLLPNTLNTYTSSIAPPAANLHPNAAHFTTLPAAAAAAPAGVLPGEVSYGSSSGNNSSSSSPAGRVLLSQLLVRLQAALARLQKGDPWGLPPPPGSSSSNSDSSGSGSASSSFAGWVHAASLISRQLQAAGTYHLGLAALAAASRGHVPHGPCRAGEGVCVRARQLQAAGTYHMGLAALVRACACVCMCDQQAAASRGHHAARLPRLSVNMRAYTESQWQLWRLLSEPVCASYCNSHDNYAALHWLLKRVT